MPEPQKEISQKPHAGISAGTAPAAETVAKTVTSAAFNWLAGGSRLSVLQKLMAILKQAKELYDHGVFTTGEYQQIRRILLGNLQQAPTAARRRFGRRIASSHAKSEVMDAVDVDAEASDPEIMDAIECDQEGSGDFGEDEIMDAVELGDSPDLAGEDILDAVEIEEDESMMDIEEGLDAWDDREDDSADYDSQDEVAMNSGMDDVTADMDADTGASFGSDSWSTGGSFGSDND